jgi:2-oxoglutarate dehydrogenase E2 component (dihydrolipoamide succinyltransferase)
MKIHEILVESQQLDEGPLLNKIGSAIGKGVGTLAKGVGAVAGGVAGDGTAIKKGWDAGKAAVARAGDDEPETAAPAAAAPAATAQAAPAAAGAPAAAPVGGPTAQPAAGAVNKAGPAGTAPAKPLQGQAKVAADKTAAATAGQDQSAAGQTMYAQVKANIDKLDKKGKQRILQLLQKSMAAPAAKPAAGSAPAAAPAAEPTATPAPAAPAAAAPEAPAAEPTAAAPTAAPAAEPTAAPAPVAPKKTGGRVKGQLSQDPRAVKRREANAAKTKQQATAPSQAEIDADREKIMGVTSDSIVRRQPMMAEGFSLFRKRA